jgi:hypothetical protein
MKRAPTGVSKAHAKRDRARAKAEEEKQKEAEQARRDVLGAPKKVTVTTIIIIIITPYHPLPPLLLLFLLHHAPRRLRLVVGGRPLHRPLGPRPRLCIGRSGRCEAARLADSSRSPVEQGKCFGVGFEKARALPVAPDRGQVPA